MSKCQIRFKNNQDDTVIQCQTNELIKDIISRYETKSGLKINELDFLYNGNKLNQNLTLAQIIEKDKEILIIVNLKKIEKNEIKNINLINSTQFSTEVTKIYEEGRLFDKQSKILGDFESLFLAKDNSISDISLKIKIEQEDVNKTIYFLDNTSKETHQNGYYENSNWNIHNHDNLNELNESNTSLVIDEKTVPFKKSFIPKKIGIYSIKLIFKKKLSNCAYMFCECKNIIKIDFSKFNTENVTDMKHMFNKCSGLKSLNLSSFNTQNVKYMYCMFNECSGLQSLNLSSFKTKNITNMYCMFSECSSLTAINLSSFNTQNVNNMEWMFSGCSSLTTLDLSSFNTHKVNSMGMMFTRCSSLTTINLSSFNTENAINIFGMFSICSSLTFLNLSSFNTKNAITMDYMFSECINLSTCGSSDKKIEWEFKKKK